MQAEDSTEDAPNSLAYDIFVRKGTEYNVNVTFAINNSSNKVTVEKTVSIRFYAEKKVSIATVGTNNSYTLTKQRTIGIPIV